MPETLQKSWVAFKVGRLGGTECQPLTRAGHVTHVESALDVFRAGGIRPQLVRDGSRLDTERVEVVFTTPYDFAKPWGCMFGNVAFQFDWDDLTEDVNFYWLGAQQYSGLRPRILITENEYPEYKRYLPGKRNGPWWRSEKTGNDYWNGEFCPEFLVEAGIPLHRIAQMRFIAGHPKKCLLKSPCPDKGHDRQIAAARLLAGACHRGLLAASRDLWVWKVKKPRKALRYAWQQLKALIIAPNQKWDGPIKFGADNAKAQAWAALGAYFQRESGFRKKLLRAFVGPKNAIKACAALIEDGLQLGDGTLPRLS